MSYNFTSRWWCSQTCVIIPTGGGGKKQKALGHCWIDHFLATRSGSKRQINGQKIGFSAEVFPDAAVSLMRGAFSVSRNGWKRTKLSPLSLRTEAFPGSQNSRPAGCALSERWRALGGVFTIYGQKGADVSGCWRCPSTGEYTLLQVNGRADFSILLCLKLQLIKYIYI